MDINDLGRVADGEQTIVSDQAAAHLGPSGFDPSRDGAINEDEYSWDTGLRTYRVYSLTENEINMMAWAPWWVRRRIIRQIKAETVFPASAIEAGTGETEGLDAKRERAEMKAHVQTELQAALKPIHDDLDQIKRLSSTKTLFAAVFFGVWPFWRSWPSLPIVLTAAWLLAAH